MWTFAHSSLQKACIYLFPDPRDCRLLVTESGMDASQINFEEPPALRWQSVISEAEKQNSITKLVPVLLARYPGNPQLVAACAPFASAEPVKATPQVAPVSVPAGAVLVRKFEKGAPEDAPVALALPEPVSMPETTPDPPAAPVSEPETAPFVANGADPVNMTQDELIATVSSLRIAVSEIYQRVTRMEDWRRRSSVMSSADLAGMRDENE